MPTWTDLYSTNQSYFPLAGTLVTFSGGTGSGALGYAIINPSTQQVTGVHMILNGTYSVAPTPVFHGNGTGAAGTSNLGGGGVASVTISNGGASYTTGAPVWLLNFSGNVWDTMINDLAAWPDNVNANNNSLTNLASIAFHDSTSISTAPSAGTWTTIPTLQNSWINFGSTLQTPQYRKDSAGQVWVRGSIKSGTFADGTLLFTLPTGYRPPADVVVQVAGQIGSVTFFPFIYVNTVGQALCYGLGGSTFLHMNFNFSIV